MPIAGPSSFLPTLDEFLPHWSRADAALGAAGPIALAGGLNLAGLGSLRAILVERRADMDSIRNEMERTRSEINRGKAALLLRLNQFNGKLRSLAPGSRWEGMLPKAFSISEGFNRVIPPLDGIQDLWTRYDVEESTITLMGGYPLTDFTTDLGALKAAYARHASAENALGLARKLRNETQKKIYEVLKQYRLRIRSEFPEGSSMLITLPRLTPQPGPAPGTVKLSGNFNPVTGKAELAWTPSTDPAVSSLQLRACVGASYQAEDETILTTYPASGPHGWTGTFGLGSPGSATAFKIFSITSDGSEKGSNAVRISRPEA
ncbi:MAG: hypothetical protein RLZZ214_710 [Verrucomicrobiota bacterium]|jgi:hypothetical protein